MGSPPCSGIRDRSCRRRRPTARTDRGGLRSATPMLPRGRRHPPDGGRGYLISGSLTRCCRAGSAMIEPYMQMPRHSNRTKGLQDSHSHSSHSSSSNNRRGRRGSWKLLIDWRRTKLGRSTTIPLRPLVGRLRLCSAGQQGYISEEITRTVGFIR